MVLSGGPNSFAPEEWAPNESGEVAGLSDTSTLDPNNENFCGVFDFLGSDPHICLPFVWRHGVMTPLPTLGGNNGAAVAINNRGQLVGASETGTATDCAPHFEAVIWSNKGEIQELPPLPGDTEAVASGINDRGDAVGISGNCARGPIEAVLWRNGTPINLGSLGGAVFNIAFGINNREQVVGQSDLPGDTTHHAFLWQNGVMADLGTLPGVPGSLATSINNEGQVVGFSDDFKGNTVALLWQSGTMPDLNTLIPADSPWFLLEALGINDRGQIAGYAFNPSTGEVHGFVLTPVQGSEDSESIGQSSAGERRRVVLPENVLKLVQQRPSFGRFVRAPNLPEEKAAVTSSPAATLSPSALNFGTIAIGSTSAAKAVVLKNIGTANLTISRIVITGSNAGDFSQTTTCGTSLAAGASCKINVKFKPTGSGTRTAALNISDNAAGSPQKVTLSGIGTVAKFSPATLSFGSVGVGATSLPKTVILTNVGTTTLTITGIAITGTNAGDFAQTHTCGSSLAAGAACNFSIKFTPSVLGTRTAVLSVTDNAAGSPQKVALSGIGVKGGTLTGYCVHGIFDPHLGCRLTADPSQCPQGALAINPTTLAGY